LNRSKSLLKKLAILSAAIFPQNIMSSKCTMTMQNKLQVEHCVSNEDIITVVLSFSDRTDSSGIRFYISKELRQHDLGYLSFGTYANAAALAIPPRVERFNIDSYCSPQATQVTIQYNNSFSYIRSLFLFIAFSSIRYHTFVSLSSHSFTR
jgi:hypothetical protein